MEELTSEMMDPIEKGAIYEHDDWDEFPEGFNLEDVSRMFIGSLV